MEVVAAVTSSSSKREKETGRSNGATKDNCCPAGSDVNFCATGQCYCRQRRCGLNFCQVLHRDRARPPRPPSLSSLPNPATGPLSLPPPPQFTWSYGQGPTRFRERIYISRNRPNFYTSRRRGPENKTTSFLPITARFGGKEVRGMSRANWTTGCIE